LVNSSKQTESAGVQNVDMQLLYCRQVNCRASHFSPPVLCRCNFTVLSSSTFRDFMMQIVRVMTHNTDNTLPSGGITPCTWHELTGNTSHQPVNHSLALPTMF